MADVCAKYGAAYIAKYGDRMPRPHRRVLQLLADCGTGRLGRVRFRCAQCASEGKNPVHHTDASCGNRHCPGCQTANNGAWCVEQTKKLLPCEYFFVTFTIPDTLRDFVRSNQRLCYDALMNAAAHALRVNMAKPKHCGVTQTGFTSVLHTFGRNLSYHPHVHVIIAGGGITPAGQWKSVPPTCMVPVHVLSTSFRIEFERLVGKRADECGVHRSEFRKEFVSFSKPVGDGVATLKYLSRYMFRTAITNERIVSIENHHVTFRYRPSGKRTERTMRLPVFKFLHRFLQHVLPRGFHRVRHYGFLSRRTNIILDELRELIVTERSTYDADMELEEWTVPRIVHAIRTIESGPKCPTCGSVLIFERFTRIRPPPLELRSHLTATAHRVRPTETSLVSNHP